MTTIRMTPLEIALDLSRSHEDMARTSSDDAARRHTATMRLFNKCVEHFGVGSTPTRVAPGVWIVSSRSTAGQAYRVESGPETCTCEAGMHKRACWHLLAMQCVELAANAPDESATLAIRAEHGDGESDPEWGGWDTQPGEQPSERDDIADDESDDDDFSEPYDPIHIESLFEQAQRYA